ncbi:hypothetical protein GRS80_13325 [Natrialba sp. INN-245]|nr:hypothetical protein [Natrialba sp. INN-245]
MTSDRPTIGRRRPYKRHRGSSLVIVATERQCTPDRTTAVQSVCTSFQLLPSYF